MRCTVDLINDGSYPNAAEDALLVAAGGVGEIVQVGAHVDSNTPIYLVDFDAEICDRLPRRGNHAASDAAMEK